MRNFVRVYEEFTDSSAFEHINPNNIKRVYVHKEDKEGHPIVSIEYFGEEEIHNYPFLSYKDAHRFIKRVGGIS